MSQILTYWRDEQQFTRELPDENQKLINGVCWGEHWRIFTPAYWFSQYIMRDLDKESHSYYKARKGLFDEIVFCLLGGFGVKAELAIAAFEHCTREGLVDSLEPDEKNWAACLSKPLTVNNKKIKYRYPNQKARYIANAARYLRCHKLDGLNGKKLRNSLLEITGIGPKTAGWIARNCTDTDDVAILDIHLVRAGVICGVFSPDQNVSRNYFEMESQFVTFCNALGARTAIIDCLIWDQMREMGKVALTAYKYACQQKNRTHSAYSNNNLTWGLVNATA